MTTVIIADPDPADQNELVVGVDTHKDFHVAAVTSSLGRVLASQRFPATSKGYVLLLRWAREFGNVRRIGVEGTGSYGVALARFLRTESVEVIEVNRPDRAKRRRRGKNDSVDAEAAAQAVISLRATAVPKSADGPVEQIRVYKIGKDSAVKARTQAINHLKAILVNADPELRESMAGLGQAALVTACAQLDDTISTPTAVTYTLSILARRIRSLSTEIAGLTARITGLIQAVAPALLDLYGVGPDSAATLLVTAGDNPDRLTSESGFAAVCGVSPVEMSSGKSQRHRLNRGGDRQANAALYRITLTRLREDGRTRAYATRRTAEGRSKREIMRCLKRYLVRDIYRIICNAFATSPNPSTA